MPDNEQRNEKEQGAGGRRFRLPKLFADGSDLYDQASTENDAGPENDASEVAPAEQVEKDVSVEALPAASLSEDTDAPGSLDPLGAPVLGASAVAAVTATPAKASKPVELDDAALPGASDEAPVKAATPSRKSGKRAVDTVEVPVTSEEPEVRAKVIPASVAANKIAPSAAPGATPVAAQAAVGPEVLQELRDLRSQVDYMSNVLQELNERGLAQDNVFDTLHGELQDYKNDFIYEHLKPVVRPLLFLYDSLERFENELQGLEQQVQMERRSTLAPVNVRENIVFFRDQLVESLRICEVTPMDAPEGRFDSRLQKAVDTVPVDPDQDGIIQRVVRSGWYLNGRVFRPAEVIVGKNREDYNSQVWNYGKKA